MGDRLNNSTRTTRIDAAYSCVTDGVATNVGREIYGSPRMTIRNRRSVLRFRDGIRAGDTPPLGANTMRILFVAMCLFACSGVPAFTADLESLSTGHDGRQTINGLVTPLDQRGERFYLQNSDGQVEVQLASSARIGLLFRESNILDMLQKRKIVLKEVRKTYPLPQKLYVKVHFKDWKSAERAIEKGELRGGILYTTALADHLPTAQECWLSGQVGEFKKGHITPIKIVKLGDRTFTVSTAGHNHSEQIVGFLKAADIKPFVNQASVYGEWKDEIFLASDVLLRPIPDQTIDDDPKLPRYLFIGDSISGNYGPVLRAAVAGKLNIHHPPTNCGPTGKGRARARIWLGNYKQQGRHWDVISFNFGHWDAGNSKAEYQANLHNIIKQLQDTGAKLVWVTTCPVPNGYPPAGDLVDGKAPGRKAGVMQKHLNPWAAEVIGNYPSISVCDQWQFVKDHDQDIYRDWWQGKNVHFSGEPARKLGELLSRHVLSRVNASE